MQREYSGSDLITLTSGEGYRQKIGMYLSADRQEAINLGLRELIVNTQDEYEVYKPDDALLKITLNIKEKTITVEDNLRGIPVAEREDGINSLEAAFLLPHSGAKHNEGAYSSAIGVNGQGLKIICHTSEWLNVTSKRDNKIYNMGFKSNDKGAYISSPLSTTKNISREKLTGTIIRYKPDAAVYGDIFVDTDSLRKMLQEVSLFTKGLKILLVIDDKEEIFLSKNGLIDGLKNKNAISSPFSYFYEDDDCKVELALQWVTKKGEVKGYANGLYMPDGGAFVTSFKTSLTRTFNSLAKQKFNGDLIRSCLDGYISVKVRVGQFSNQAKTALANKEAGTATSFAISSALKDFKNKNEGTFDLVVETLLKLSKAEAAAERARRHVFDAVKDIEKNQKKKVFASDKLKDAETLGQKSTLLLVEGNSAGAAMAAARDYKTFGILMLRGKIINALSNPEEKIFENEEIKLLLSAMNINPKRYDSNQLRYGSIGICVDGDSDGNHIALLIMSALQYLAPEFIKEGRLKWLKAPLYIVKNNKKEDYFYSDEEFNKSKIKGAISRAKGLGSLSADQARASMFGKN